MEILANISLHITHTKTENGHYPSHPPNPRSNSRELYSKRPEYYVQEI
jgi:hypothetical protein